MQDIKLDYFVNYTIESYNMPPKKQKELDPRYLLPESVIGYTKKLWRFRCLLGPECLPSMLVGCRDHPRLISILIAQILHTHGASTPFLILTLGYGTLVIEPPFSVYESQLFLRSTLDDVDVDGFQCQVTVDPDRL